MSYSSISFVYRYVIAVGLENGNIQLLTANFDNLNQWELWHNVDER